MMRPSQRACGAEATSCIRTRQPPLPKISAVGSQVSTMLSVGGRAPRRTSRRQGLRCSTPAVNLLCTPAIFVDETAELSKVSGLCVLLACCLDEQWRARWGRWLPLLLWLEGKSRKQCVCFRPQNRMVNQVVEMVHEDAWCGMDMVARRVCKMWMVSLSGQILGSA